MSALHWSKERQRFYWRTVRFQRNRDVQDAPLATNLQLELATRQKVKLYLLSKDSATCYNRISRWVMGCTTQGLGFRFRFRV